MKRVLCQRLIAILCLSVLLFTATPVTAHAALAQGPFQYTDIKKDAFLSGLGTQKNPVWVASSADMISKYMKIKGQDFGRMYFIRDYNGPFSDEEYVRASKMLYPFVMSIFYGYDFIGGRYVYYFEITYENTQYAQPSINAAVQAADSLVTPDMGYIDIIRSFNRYLIDRVEYDYPLAANMQQGRMNPGLTAYGALVNRLAICEGYASAFALMCHRAGIPCYQVEGSAGGEAHTWNVVYLFGSLFYVDVTHNDGQNNPDYLFMVPESKIKQTHYFATNNNWDAIWPTHNKNLPEAQILHELGLFAGTGNGFELDRHATRAEMVVMLTRLLGLEQTALTERYAHPFTDVPAWASDYVGLMSYYGIVNGLDATTFGSNNGASVNDYLTMLLRVLGYAEGQEFSWQDPFTLSNRLGLTAAGQYGNLARLLRGDLAALSLQAILVPDVERNYWIDILQESVIDPERYDNVAFYLNARRK